MSVYLVVERTLRSVILCTVNSGLWEHSVLHIRARFDTKKWRAVSARPCCSLFLDDKSSRSKSRVSPFVDRSEMIRRALFLC